VAKRILVALSDKTLSDKTLFIVVALSAASNGIFPKIADTRSYRIVLQATLKWEQLEVRKEAIGKWISSVYSQMALALSPLLTIIRRSAVISSTSRRTIMGRAVTEGKSPVGETAFT